MGFSGDFILARRKTSLLALPLIGGIEPVRDDDEEGVLRTVEYRPGGWQVVLAEHALPEGRDWLRAIVAQTRGPVMIGSIFQDKFCVVRGLEPGDGEPWSVRLHPESRKPLEPRAAWMASDSHLSGAEAVDAVARWSAAAGAEADVDRLATALAGKPAYFVEELFFRLLNATGLGEPFDYVDTGENHSLAGAWADPDKLQASITALKPGMRRVLECREHEECFAKVLLRPDGDYELEYRDPASGEHRRAVTPSLDEVLAAMTEWSASELGWRDGRDGFEWSPVDDAPHSG